MTIRRYTAADQQAWNAFIETSKNGTFLLSRNYMDYHADRFTDHSLLIYDEKERLIAVMPAHQKDGQLISHGGLTYGGIVSNARMTTPMMLSVFEQLLAYCKEQSLTRLIYKTIPSIYASIPAEEDRYALFYHNAALTRRDVLSVIHHSQPRDYQERRQRKIKQAQKAGLTVSKSDDYASFWAILESNLQQRYGVKPVHSLAEITLLAERFPSNIALYLCKQGDTPLAGVVVYVTAQVAHIQYISASETGKETGALDLLFAELLERVYAKHAYIDFGTSTEQNGRHLNTGLIDQKEGFGARAIIHDYYEIAIA